LWLATDIILTTKLLSISFFFIRENSILQKTHFVGLNERVKLRLSRALTRDARPDSNSRPVVHISSPLPSRYATSKPLSLFSVLSRYLSSLQKKPRRVKRRARLVFFSFFFFLFPVWR